MATSREQRRGLSKLRDTYERMIDGWLRPVGHGWRLTDNQGRVYPLNNTDGDQLSREAKAKIDELFLGLEGQVWYMMIPAVAVAILGLVMLDQLALYGAMPAAVYFVPCLMFLLKDFFTEIQFAIAMNRWREELACRARAACGRANESGDYSLWKDTRLGVWAGWVLVGPGTLALMIPNHPAISLAGFGFAMIGTFILRRHYGVTG
jgi:hypothetical protein